MMRHRLAMVGTAVAAIAAAALIVFLARSVMNRNPKPDQPVAAPTVDIDGRHTPLAGSVPWSGAIDDPKDLRRVYVFADNDSLADRDVCPVLADRAYVRETRTQILIKVAGYGHRGSSGLCDAAARGPVRTTVQLATPLGNRTLIDTTTGARHPILDATTVPAAHYVPTSCAKRALTWDEASGIATREYIHPAGRSLCIVSIQSGATAAIASVSPDFKGCRAVSIHGFSAQCWHVIEPAGQTYVLAWDTDGNTGVQVTVDLPADDPHAFEELLRTARSVH